ncbi:MAG: NHLP bacteriocin system secretion protein [Labilithrix sp.]|nr:NHLP bacteriocin system secretion protein [Labilithrix sp.]MCW5813432.1 NHLP bacteriocin system secretion protein [Labilithrix sp.]
MADSKLFRKAALDRLSSPEQLHTLMRVTNAKAWLALAGCALVIATAIAWGSLGRVRSKVHASGILLGGAGLSEVLAETEGELVSVEVSAGDQVKQGQLVAQVAQPALDRQIEGLARRLDELDHDVDAGTVTASLGARRDRLREELERLRKTRTSGAKLYAAAAGRVFEVRAVPGERVTPGTPLATIERATPEGQELEALLYFDSHVGKSLRPGMQVEIAPSVVKKERAGVLLGKVRSVEQYPSTRSGMMGALRNEQLVDAFIQAAGGAPIAVRAELERGATPSGYRWSNGEGPEVTLTSGTRCEAAVVTRASRPIALVFPALDDEG